MSNEITMPKLSDTMEEGKIIRWLKHPGDSFRRGDAIAEVETDKADMVLEAFEDGVLEEIKLKEGESAAVGTVIATSRPAGKAPAEKRAEADEGAEKGAEAGEGAEEPEPETRPHEEMLTAPHPDGEHAEAGERTRATVAPETEEEEGEEEVPGPEIHPSMSVWAAAGPTAIGRPPRPQPEPRPQPSAEEEPGGEHAKLRASPLARRAAEEAGIDLSQVRATGPDGRITKRDIDAFVREQQLFRMRRIIAPREGERGTRIQLSKMRKTIAQRMAASKREIPHYYVTVEVDMEEAVRFKKSLEAAELFEEEISYNDIIVKATALALGRYPRVNASYDNDFIVIHPHVNIGMAVAVEDGLLLPVIKNCERLSLPEIARAAHKLVAKAARGGFTTDELSGPTFTISNMGMIGVEHFAAVIVPPQAAILAVSGIKERPVVRNGQIVVGRIMMITLSCDHRIIDGVVAGRFLMEIKRFLENPASLLV